MKNIIYFRTCVVFDIFSNILENHWFSLQSILDIIADIFETCFVGFSTANTHKLMNVKLPLLSSYCEYQAVNANFMFLT